MKVRDETTWQRSLAKEIDDKRYITELLDSLDLKIEADEPPEESDGVE